MGAYSTGLYTDGEIVPVNYVQKSPFGPSGGDLKVYVPSMMPQIPMSEAASFPEILDASCYCNANECKPSVSRRVSSKNYIVARAPNWPYSGGRINYGAGLICWARLTNEDNLYFKLVKEEADPSW